MKFEIKKLLILLSLPSLFLSMNKEDRLAKCPCKLLINDTVIMCRKDTFYYKQKDTLPYLLQFPSAYNLNRKLPLVVYLHSGNSKLNTLDALENFGLPEAYRERNKDNFLALSPLLINSHDTWVNKAQAVLDLIKSIKSKFLIDDVYLTGHSLGSNGSLYIASVSKNIFAAVAVLGAGYQKNETVPRFTNPPIWMVHAANDENVSAVVSERTAKELKKFNKAVKYTVMPNFTHSMLLELYKEDTLYNWLMLHHL